MSFINPTLKKVILTLGAILLTLPILLDLVGLDDTQDDVSTSSFMDNSGVIPGAKTATLASAFVDRDFLFVFFEQNGQVYFNYIKTGKTWLSEAIPLNLKTDYGVEVVAFDDPQTEGEKVVCLFLKNGNKDTGKIEYSCSPLRYDTTPSFSFQNPTALEFATLSDELNGLLAVSQSPNRRDEFFLVLNDYFWTNGLGSTYHIKRLRCTMQKGVDITAPNLLNNVCRLEGLDTDYKIRSVGPSLLVLPSQGDTTAQNLFYTFFAEAEAQYDNNIYYLIDGDSGRVPITRKLIPMLDHVGKTRPTDKRNSVAILERNLIDDVGYVYLAYKNDTDAVVRFSRISLDDILNSSAGSPGDTFWAHCELKKFNERTGEYDYIVHSQEGPTLFQYEKKLYLLYSDEKNENKLSYYRIDQMNLTSTGCTG